MQVRAEEVLRDISASLTRLFDVTATKDATNCVAKANVVVDEQTLLTDVPVSYLLFLEKQLTDMHTFIKKLPVLDAAEAWSFNDSADCRSTEPAKQALGCGFDSRPPLQTCGGSFNGKAQAY